MTDLDTGPSSIRDDSICESSLPPNKSSVDIVERLRFDAVRCELQFSKGVAQNIIESAAEIERLRRELDAANSNHRSMAHLLAETGMRLEHAESAVAVAYEALDLIAHEHRDDAMPWARGVARAAVSKKTAESGHSPLTRERD